MSAPAFDMGARLDADALFDAIARDGKWVVVPAATARLVAEMQAGVTAPAHLFEPERGFEAVVVAVPQADGSQILAGGQGRGPFAILPERDGYRFHPMLYRHGGTGWFRVAGFASATEAVRGAACLHRAPMWTRLRDVTTASGLTRTWVSADEAIVERVLMAEGFEPGRIPGSVSRIYRVRRM